MNSRDLPTDRSIEISDLQRHGYAPTNSLNSVASTPNNLYIHKMASHLEFMEAEFQRSINWQKQLLNQLIAQQSYASKQNLGLSKDGEAKQLILSIHEQRVVRDVLAIFVGQKKEVINIKQLIKDAAKQLQRRNQPSINSLLQYNEENESSLEFPQPKRVITLNDLAPSTQRENSPPPSLPPHTPKIQRLNPHFQQNRQSLFSNNYSQNDSQKDLQDSEVKIKGRTEFKQYKESNRYKEVMLIQDSFGKRLFQKQKDPIIFIKDQSLQNSQVSLSLSQSNTNKKVPIFRQVCEKNSNNQSPIPSERILQTQYVRVVDTAQIQKKKGERQPEQNLEVVGLRFAENQKRRIGKYEIKKQNLYAYDNQKFSGKLKKMQDTFGMAYQEYYCEAANLAEREKENNTWKRQQ